VAILQQLPPRFLAANLSTSFGDTLAQLTEHVPLAQSLPLP